MNETARRMRLAALPALAVLVIAVALGAAASSGNEKATPIDQQSAVEALSVVLTLLALVLLAALVYVAAIWLQTAQYRRGRGAGNAVGFKRLHQLLVSLATFLVFIGAAVLFLYYTRHRKLGAGGAAAGAHSQAAKKVHTVPFSAAASAWTLLAVALVIGTLAAVSLLRRRRRRRDAPDLHELDPENPSVDFGASALLEPLEEVAIADPRSEPDPRKAVITAWIAMADAIGRIWRPRAASEAPREYLREALVTAGVQPVSAGRLTSLFEVARWSDQNVGEEMRTDAIAALETVRGELREAS